MTFRQGIRLGRCVVMVPVVVVCILWWVWTYPTDEYEKEGSEHGE